MISTNWKFLVNNIKLIVPVNSNLVAIAIKVLISLNNMKKIKFKLSALTLIEVLISIAVFSIGILSVSYLIISNVWLSERTKLKTTATMLAKEGIELVYNRRDTNIKKDGYGVVLNLKKVVMLGNAKYTFMILINLNELVLELYRLMKHETINLIV